MDWKAALKSTVAASQQAATAENEAAIRESERRKVFAEQLNQAMFALRCGADEFCREAQGMGMVAAVASTDAGFEVTASLHSASVRLSVRGSASDRRWSVFYVVTIRPTAGATVEIPHSTFKRYDETAIPELMAALLAQAA